MSPRNDPPRFKTMAQQVLSLLDDQGVHHVGKLPTYTMHVKWKKIPGNFSKLLPSSVRGILGYTFALSGRQFLRPSFTALPATHAAKGYCVGIRLIFRWSGKRVPVHLFADGLLNNTASDFHEIAPERFGMNPSCHGFRDGGKPCGNHGDPLPGSRLSLTCGSN